METVEVPDDAASVAALLADTRVTLSADAQLALIRVALLRSPAPEVG